MLLFHKCVPLSLRTVVSLILGRKSGMMLTIAECTVGCFDFAYSVVARSGSFAMVGSRLSQDEEYLKAVKDHILGMIVTTRVQFLIPDCLKRYTKPYLLWYFHSWIPLTRYLGGFISRLATLGTRWNMHASRKILLKHFDARAAEYRDEMAGGDNMDQANPEHADKPVRFAFFSPL